MKKIKQCLLLFALCFAVFSISPITVFASENTEQTSGGDGDNPFSDENTTSDTGSAIQDILKDGRFQGAISSISKITAFVDVWFVRIISLVSFFIISAAMLKNACAGAYCANSKFWDKVADAHQKTEALNLAGVKNFFAGGQGIMNTSAGGIRDFFLGIIPNIKAFTDFEDADIEPKAYFMKAIPQMIACVIIGIFIYNGYYRDTAVTVGEMGSVIIERTLGSVNPDSFVNKIFNTTGWPKFPWEKDKSREGQYKQAIAKELKSLVASNVPDVSSAQQKTAVVANIVNTIQSSCSELSPYWDGSAAGCEGDKYVYNISGISSYLSAALSGGALCDIDEDDKDNVVVKMQISMGNIVDASTSLNASNNTAYITFTLKRVVNDGVSGSSGVRVDEFGQQTTGGTVQLANDTVYRPSSQYVSAIKDDPAGGKIVTVSTAISIDFSEFAGSGTSATGITISGAPNGVKQAKDGSKQVSQLIVSPGDYKLVDGKISLGCLQAGQKKSGTMYLAFQ